MNCIRFSASSSCMRSRAPVIHLCTRKDCPTSFYASVYAKSRISRLLETGLCWVSKRKGLCWASRGKELTKIPSKSPKTTLMLPKVSKPFSGTSIHLNHFLVPETP